MEDSRKNIDEFFRRHMTNHAETPPPAVWEQLEQRLDNHGSGKKKRPFPLWWMWAISGIILISASVIIAGNLLDDNNVNTNVAQEAKHQAVDAPTGVASNDDAGIEQKVTGNINDNLNQNNTTNKEGISQSLNKKEAELAMSAPSDREPISKVSQEKTPEIPQITDPIDENRWENEEIDNRAKAEKRRTVEKLELIPASTAGIPYTKAVVDIKRVRAIPAIIAELEFEPAYVSEITKLVVSKGNVQLNEYKFSEIASPLFEIEEAEVIVPQSNSNKKDIQADTTSRLKPLVDVSIPGLPDTSILDNSETEVVKDDRKEQIKLPIEAGIKAGYNKGFNSGWRADRLVVSPYIEYKLPSDLSLVFQPAYLSGNINTGNTQQDKAYHEITSSSFDSTSKLVRGVIDSSVLTPNPPDTVFYSYEYNQTYDSIYVSYSVKQSKLWEVELPLLLKYSVTDNLSVFAGGSATISSVITTEEKVDRYTGLSKTYMQDIDPQTFYVTAPNQPPPAGPPPVNEDDIFIYTTDPFSSYVPGQQANSNKNTFVRYGFMLGASYTIRDKWLLDLMIHKSGVDKSVITDNNVQKLYTQPYIRFTVGYKLFKAK